MEIQKKISFGFSKSSKPLNILKLKSEEKKNDIELIDCLEGQSIKIKNIIEEKKGPLIIPLRDNAKSLFDRVKSAAVNKSNEDKDEKPDSLLSLDELAAKELIEEAAQRSSSNINAHITKVDILPVSDNKQPVQNDNESTLDDYNNVPISDYGLAMLRGMGWTESTGIGNQNQQITNVLEPELRPRGMGLGADKVIKLKETSVTLDKDGKELSLTKGAFAKVIAGKHKGNYCEVLSLDDETGRIIVKTTIEKSVQSINGFLLTPVTKEEYVKNSKVLNNAKYDEFTKKSSRNEQRTESDDNKSGDREYKSSRKKSLSSNSDEADSKHPAYKAKHALETQVSSSNYSRHKKYRGRSSSPNSSKRRRSSSPENKRKSRRGKEDSDKSEDDEDKGRSKRKKSKKHKKYEEDSSDEEYKKRKKSSKSKKHHKRNRYSSDEDTSRSKYKQKHSKAYR